MSIPVFMPINSTLPLISLSGISSVHNLLWAVWENLKQQFLSPTNFENMMFSRLSLRTLANPVPIMPEETLRKRVMVSARDSGWAQAAIQDKVPSHWCDPENVHVFLYVDQGLAMQAAENLHEKLWGQNLNDKLKVLSEDGGGTWKYLPKEYLDSLQSPSLGYHEDVLLFREEYSAAMKSFDLARKGRRHGVVVTGQPGAGQSSLLYYLLLQLISKKTPVALERPHYFFLFTDDGVTMHALNEPCDLFPKITWALSDSNGEIRQPCAAFLEASQRGCAWVVQTVPLERGWNLVGVFIMKYFSVREITALGKILGLDVDNIRRIYEQWGPSTRTCVQLSRNPSFECSHEAAVIRAAANFIWLAPPISNTEVNVLFSMGPDGVTEELRQIPIGHTATDRIGDIILYAAADAEAKKRIRFFLTISKQPGFRMSAGKMFKDLILSWFYAHTNDYILPCDVAQGTSSLQIPACGEDHTVFFSSKNTLRKDLRTKALPLLLLPTSPAFPTIDAIVLTKEFVITIQVTNSDSHTANGAGFPIIEDYLPRVAKRSKKWRHVFITNNEYNATSLRSQAFSDLPRKVQISSAVFDVGKPSIARKHVEKFKNQKNKQCKLQLGDQQDDDADMNAD